MKHQQRIVIIEVDECLLNESFVHSDDATPVRPPKTRTTQADNGRPTRTTTRQTHRPRTPTKECSRPRSRSSSQRRCEGNEVDSTSRISPKRVRSRSKCRSTKAGQKQQKQQGVLHQGTRRDCIKSLSPKRPSRTISDVQAHRDAATANRQKLQELQMEFEALASRRQSRSLVKSRGRKEQQKHSSGSKQRRHRSQPRTSRGTSPRRARVETPSIFSLDVSNSNRTSTSSTTDTTRTVSTTTSRSSSRHSSHSGGSTYRQSFQREARRAESDLRKLAGMLSQKPKAMRELYSMCTSAL